MKKLILNISDADFEKFRLESMEEQKDIKHVLTERLFYKPFSDDVLEAFDNMIDGEVNQIMGEK